MEQIVELIEQIILPFSVNAAVERGAEKLVREENLRIRNLVDS